MNECHKLLLPHNGPGPIRSFYIIPGITVPGYFLASDGDGIFLKRLSDERQMTKDKQIQFRVYYSLSTVLKAGDNTA